MDSICNDLCAHWMMNTVSERSLRQAQTVVEDRAERAARELMQHDVAMQAMQAGPTSLERAMELMHREKQVRAEVPADYIYRVYAFFGAVGISALKSRPF